MAELRWNPMIKDWVMVASNRQNRPQMPKDWCPFCPDPNDHNPNKKVPDSFEVLEYDNDFPALSQNPPEPDDVATDFYKVRKSHGKCEVVLYSPDHYGTLKELSDSHLRKLVDLWVERFNVMKSDPEIKYVFIFENRGNEKIGKKIREATLEKIPYMLVVGDRDIENKTVSVRMRSGEDLGAMSIDAFEALLKEAVDTKNK